jgi:Domain of unknown function (DUF4386)
MISRITETSPQVYARIAGILYLSLVPLAILGFPYGPTHMFVSGDAAATANNILSSAFRFRLSIIVDLVGALINIFVVLALYRLLKPVNKGLASLMVVFLLLSVPIAMLNELSYIAALLLVSGAPYLMSFTVGQLQSMALFLHDVHKYGLGIAEIFWGLWLFPMGYLVFKSGFLPKILGILLMIGCFGWLIESFALLLVPDYSLNLELTSIGEVILPLWLVIRGVDVAQWKQRAHAVSA